MTRLDVRSALRKTRRRVGAPGAGVRHLRQRLDARTATRVVTLSVRRRRTHLLLLSAFVVIALGAVAVLGVTAQERHEVDMARTTGLDQAKQRTEQVLSFDPQTADADVARAREAVTGPFAEQFGALLTQLVQPSLGRGLATRTRVTDASVISAEPRQMTALLFLEQSAAAPGQPPRVQPSRARVTVTEVAGVWLISDLQSR